MRRTPPLIVGAGPGGCAAAIVLARAGLRPVIVDRDAEIPDRLCGGFLSWRTAEQMQELGLDLRDLAAAPVQRLKLISVHHTLDAWLPAPGYAVSRRTLDRALREEAIAAGARLEIDTIRGIDSGAAVGKRRTWTGDGVFLATGKHDVRGLGRPRRSRDPALGLRLRLPNDASRSATLAGVIELHLFERSYAGVVLQEDGSANVCLAVRKSRLASCGGDPRRLLVSLRDDHPLFGNRLGTAWNAARTETIGAVPYGWLAQRTAPGLFRLGDQAAVIPSLAGEGLSIALASGVLAAQVWLEHGADGAATFQRRIAAAASPALRVAAAARMIAERPLTARLSMKLAERVPAALNWLMGASRVAPASLAPRSLAA